MACWLGKTHRVVSHAFPIWIFTKTTPRDDAGVLLLKQRLDVEYALPASANGRDIGPVAGGGIASASEQVAGDDIKSCGHGRLVQEDMPGDANIIIVWIGHWPLGFTGFAPCFAEPAFRYHLNRPPGLFERYHTALPGGDTGFLHPGPAGLQGRSDDRTVP